MGRNINEELGEKLFQAQNAMETYLKIVKLADVQVEIIDAINKER